MKSLGTTATNTPKVTNDEINKLLDSIGVDLSKSVPMSAASPVAGTDSLLALSRDLGIDLGPSTASLMSPPPPHSTPMPNIGGVRPQVQPNVSASPATPSPHPSVAVNVNQPVRSGPISMPTSPALMGLGGAGVPRAAALNTASTTPMRTPHINPSSTPSTPSVSGGQAAQRTHQTSSSASAAVQSQRPAQQPQFRPSTGRPQRPTAPNTARRPPPGTQQYQQQQQMQQQQQAMQGGVRPNMSFNSSPSSSPALSATSQGQRSQQRPQMAVPGNRPTMRPRPHHGPAGANRGPRDSASPAGSPRSGSPVNQNRPQQQRPHPQQQQQQQRRMQTSHQQQGRPQHPQQQQHPLARPVGRPPNRPPNAGGASDMTSWLTDVMRSLPADRQERLAELLRGFQTGAIPPQVFLQQAQEMLGARFSDLVAVTQNRTQPRPQAPSQMTQQAQSQMRPVGLVRPQAQMGVGPQNPLGVSISRPGMQMSGPMSSSSPAPMQQAMSGTAMSPVLSMHSPDGGQNLQMMQQLLLNRQQQQGNAGQPGMPNMMPLAMQGGIAPTQHPMPQMPMGLNPGVPTQAHNFDDLITRFRTIITFPSIPHQQLTVLSNQLNAYTAALNDRTGPNANIPDEERSKKLMQISSLQSLIVRRQQGQQPQVKQEHGSTPLASEPGSRAASPKPERKKKSSAGKAKADGEGSKGKKRAADSRRSDSPAPRGSGKRAKTGDAQGPEPNIDTLATQLALAGPLLSLDTVSSISGSRGGANTDLTAGWSANQMGDDLPDVYVDMAATSSSRVASRVPASRTSTMATNDDASDSDDDRNKARERSSPKPQQARKPREKREKERSGTGGGSGGDMFSIDDVIGYAGVDLREESDVFLHGQVPHSYSDAPMHIDDDTPAVLTYSIDGVDITRERSKPVDFADRNVLEKLIAKACKNAHISAVSSDVAPYLSCALHDRLRTFMELVSAAAYHRTRTQTLPPPPLDPLTRLPLYKITPNLDVKKQLSVLERVDRIREERHEQELHDREQRNLIEHQQPEGDAQKDSDAPHQAPGAADGGAEGGNGSGGNAAEAVPQSGPSENGEPPRPASAIKRQKKKDDGAETPSYTSKNMPDDLRNKISNLTALRAAGGVRKSWMNAATPAWLANATSAKATPSRMSTRSPQLSAKDDLDGVKASDLHRAQSTTALPTGSSSGKPMALDISIAGHKRTFSGVDTPGGQEAATPDSTAHVDSPSGFRSQRLPPPLLSHRSTSLSTPLTVTVRDCLFSLEREKLSGVRVGRGSGERVLIQAYNRYFL
ncbi:hypothetical protein EC988_001500 [Linderina pennispora]|nr:hypothetical protein EC988_001500 [Linderina pennispora]